MTQVPPDKRKALGRGLGALLPGAGNSFAPTVKRDYFVCAIEDVHPSKDNPRQIFDAEPLEELAESIRAQGLIQPLVVRTRPPSEGGGFILIAGERRWRAAQKAGLKEVSVVVKEATAAQAFELALVENLQRHDLNPMEEADAYQRLSDEHGYSTEHLAARVGKNRSTIANVLRLLKLPASVRELVAAGRLQQGHARALLGLDSTTAIELAAERTVKGALSVRQVESMVQRERAKPADSANQEANEANGVNEGKPGKLDKSVNLRDLEQRLQRSLQLRVTIRERSGSLGTVEIAYQNLDDFDRLLERLLKP